MSLKMNNNKLSRLPILALPSLTSLVLSHNSLSGRLAPSRIFSKMPSLSHLLLDHNLIEELPRQIFVNSTSSLTILSLSSNRFRTVLMLPCSRPTCRCRKSRCIAIAVSSCSRHRPA